MKNIYEQIVFAFFLLGMTTVGAQDINGTLDHGGLEREYILHVPTVYDASSPTPLILALHGLGDVISNFSNVGLSNLGDTENFFVVYPQAIDSQLLGTAWNNGAAAFGITLNETVDDVDFLSQLIDHIASEYNINLDRVYCTGFSMGGIMTHRMACDLNDRLAAVAAVSGPLADAIANDCLAQSPIPVMHMHGTADGTVGYADGAFNGALEAGLQGAEESIDFWTAKNGCTDDAVVETLPDTADDGLSIETRHNTDCFNDSEVLLYKIFEGAHTWLGGTNDVNANEEIWNFFNQFTLDTTPTSNEDLETANFKAYPNPFNGQLYVEFGADQFNTVNVYNVLGSLVNSQDISKNDFHMNLDLGHLQAGQYLLQLAGDDVVKTIKVQKF